jgi:hypothetical protein
METKGPEVAKVWVELVEPPKEVMPLPMVSHDTPKEAVDEAIKTLPLAPTVNPFQPVEEATIIFPVEVAIAAKSFHWVG